MTRGLAWKSATVSLAVLLAACSGGGGGSGPTIDTGSGSAPPPSPSVPPSPPPPPPPPPPPATVTDNAFQSEASTSHFLTQATFGPTPEDIDRLTGTSGSQWIIDEFAKPATLNLPWVIDFISLSTSRTVEGYINDRGAEAPTYSFWINSIEADDQLRQRMAFALSQIIVVSHHETASATYNRPRAVAYYQDILTRNAFGNYRDLLEEITYSPAMGLYLTYYQNQKEDPATNRMPDENYAREIMQLFTIGVHELNHDGTPKTDANGDFIPLFDNEDVTGLAKVFTGLSLDSPGFYDPLPDYPENLRSIPMKVFPDYHSESEKSFLGTTIPAGTSGEESIDIALDTLFEHPNMGPFLSRQMIQRFVTSDPAPGYVDRVATAFENGRFTLPDGRTVGDGRRGSLEAMIAAILMDPEARTASSRDSVTFGKVREPALRFTHWARAFNASEITPQNSFDPWNGAVGDPLGQEPYESPSVFNFYRPGYVAPGSDSGAAGMTVPELQITNSSTIVGYANFMSHFIFGENASGNDLHRSSFLPDYSDERPLASNPDALIDHLDLLLTHGNLSAETRDTVRQTLEAIPMTNENVFDYDGPGRRVGTAILMIMTSPEYLVQR